MTAPTPDLDSLHTVADTLDHHELGAAALLVRQAATAFAAVTTERDQALEALAATNKPGAFETGKTIGAAEVRMELDRANLKNAAWQRAWDTDGDKASEAFRQLDQARQILADAPHGFGCSSTPPADDPNPQLAEPCDCWKAGL